MEAKERVKGEVGSVSKGECNRDATGDLRARKLSVDLAIRRSVVAFTRAVSGKWRK